jgi:hypothetical protein
LPNFLFFFYRPKIDAEEVKELEDVGRFYMVTSPEQDHGTTSKKQVHRLFLLGQKHLPEIIEGKSTSKERNWALNILSLKQYADMNVSNVEVKDPNTILNILDQLTDKKYNNMAEVEKS